MTDSHALTPTLSVGHTRYENGDGKVVVALGAAFIHVDPATARAVAIALIHHAEVAGLPPPDPEPETPAEAA